MPLSQRVAVKPVSYKKEGKPAYNVYRYETISCTVCVEVKP